MPHLILQVENDYPRVFDLGEETISVGRHKDSDILLRDNAASVFHAEIGRTKEGDFEVRDLESQNGTTVNGDLIERAVLKDGDRIKFGKIKGVFLRRASAAKTGENPAGGSNAAPSKLDELKREESSLLRKKEIERNNLLLLRNDIEKIKIKRTEIQERMQERERELADLDKKRDSLSERVDKVQSELDEVVGKKEAVEKIRLDLEKENDETRAAIEKNRAAYDDAEALLKRKESLQADIAELEGKFELQSKKSEELEGEISALEKKCEELGAEISQREKVVDELAATITSREETVQDLEQSISKRTGELQDLEGKVSNSSAEFERLTAEADELKQKVQTESERLDAQEKEVIERVTRLQTESSERLTRIEEETENRLKQREKELTEQLSQKQEQIESQLKQQEAEATESFSRMEAERKKGLEELAAAQKTIQSHRQESMSLTSRIVEKAAMLKLLKDGVATLENNQQIECPPLRIINPDLRFLLHFFRQGIPGPGQERVDPVGYYGLAACTQGSIHRESDTVPAGDEPILVLLSGDLERDRSIIESLREENGGRTLLACWRRGVLSEVSAEMSEWLSKVSGILSFDRHTEKKINILQAGVAHMNVPLPSPIGIPEWDFSMPADRRSRGIYVSANGFDPENPIHRNRISQLNELAGNTEATVTLCRDPETEEQEGPAISEGNLSRIPTPENYSDYLRQMAEHSLVMGFGASFVDTDVMQDAVMAGCVYWGADRSHSAAEAVFPDTTIGPDDSVSAKELGAKLLSDPEALGEMIEKAKGVAEQLYGFEAVRDRLGEFLQSLK